MGLEFTWVDGLEARKIDPNGIAWPADSKVVFVSDGDQIIGRSSIMNVPMIEGTWLRDDHRNGTMAARLILEVERKYREHGEEAALAFAPDEEVASYLRRFGYEEQPLRMFLKPLVAKQEAA